MSQTDVAGDGFITGVTAVRVPVYSDAAARDARPVPAVEGKLVWLSDVQGLSVFDGTGWVGV
jgi:hypothetical protein